MFVQSRNINTDERTIRKTSKSNNMRFKISLVDNTPEIVMGNVTDYDTANNLLVFQSESINTIKIGDDKYRFNTGFIPDPIKRNRYIPEDEKEVLLKEQDKAAKRVSKELLGNEKTKLDDTDRYLWKQDQYSKFVINNDTTNLIYDTERLEHLILYWQIVSDAFGLVGYNIDHSMFKNAPYFLQEIKDAEIRESAEEVSKVKAISKIDQLSETGDNEALLYLCWSLGDRSDNMLGFTKPTSGATLVKALFNYVNGKTKQRNKKSAVAEFMKSYAEYKASRETFMIKVVIRVADYHNYIYTNKDGVYVTKDGITLGKTLQECIDKLEKPANRDILDEITTDVMKILSNDF